MGLFGRKDSLERDLERERELQIELQRQENLFKQRDKSIAAEARRRAAQPKKAKAQKFNIRKVVSRVGRDIRTAQKQPNFFEHVSNTKAFGGESLTLFDSQKVRGGRSTGSMFGIN